PVRLDGDTQTTDITDVLADGECAVDVLGAVELARGELVVLGDERLGALVELCPVGLRPSAVQAPVTVVPAALVVEAVPDLVPDHCPDRTVVGGIVGG